jgi:O-antigen/teichoic acid export membrane protein
MSRGKKFAKKTIIYSIGNFGSKVLTFLLVPYYTHYIATAEYGIYDILHTTISLLMPLVTLQTQEAIIAGMIDEEKDKSQIIKVTSLIVIGNCLVSLLLYFILSRFVTMQYGIYFILLLCIKSVFSITQQYARGFGKTKIYAVSGIVYTLLFLALNILQISVWHKGIVGLFVSEVVASGIVSVAILFLVPEIVISFKVAININEAKRIIKYSIPLIPNTICWWLINASDRYVIGFSLGNSANGIYAISYKFANVIQTITGLIYLAWQEISLEEYKSKDRDTFISTFFNSYMKLLLSGVLIAITMTRIVIKSFFAIEYHDSWKYTSWLYLGVVFTSLATFLNTCYLANGKTTEIFKGTFIAGITNLLVDIILIRYIGVFAASLSTLVSAFILLLHRVNDNKKFYSLEVNRKTFYIMSSLCLVFSILILCFDHWLADLMLFLSTVIISLVFNKDIIAIIYRKIRK